MEFAIRLLCRWADEDDFEYFQSTRKQLIQLMLHLTNVKLCKS